MHQKMAGQITFNRPRGGGTDHVQIEVTDKVSGTRFLTLRMDLDKFAEALMGLGYTPCEFDLYPKYVGFVHEHKTVHVTMTDDEYRAMSPVGPAYELSPGEKRLLHELEVDGWEARRDDLRNHHRAAFTRDKLWKISISMHRHVEPKK